MESSVPVQSIKSMYLRQYKQLAVQQRGHKVQVQQGRDHTCRERRPLSVPLPARPPPSQSSPPACQPLALTGR